MNLTDLFFAQLVDPFRIGITIALMLTMLRTRADTGVWLPSAFGVIFISVLIPMMLSPAQGDKGMAIVVGFFSTSVLLALALGARALVLRARGR